MRLAIGLSVLCSIGCGALGEPEQNGHRLADGLAPYRRAAKVEVCQGTAELVAAAPSSGEQGVCRPADRALRTCTSQTDCGTHESCICGRCTVKLCEFSLECPNDLKCAGSAPKRCARRCDDDTRCEGGERCIDGICQTECTDTSGCGEGELCFGGKCTVIACGPSGPSCSAGQVCDLARVEGALRAPSVLVTGGLTVLYAEIERQGTIGVLRAESRDGRRFVAVPEAPVLVPQAGQTRIGTPSAIVTSSGVELFVDVDGTSIARSESADGIGFGPVETVITPTAAWEVGSVAAPGAVRIGTRVFVFYEGGAGAGIGAYLSDGGGAFVPAFDGPILTLADFDNPPHFTALERVGAPSAVVVETALGKQELRLFVDARGREDTDPMTPDGGAPPITSSIAVAATDLDDTGSFSRFTVSPYNPVLAELVNLAPVNEAQPSVVFAGSEWRMYYESDDGLYFATNPPR